MTKLSSTIIKPHSLPHLLLCCHFLVWDKCIFIEVTKKMHLNALRKFWKLTLIIMKLWKFLALCMPPQKIRKNGTLPRWVSEKSSLFSAIYPSTLVPHFLLLVKMWQKQLVSCASARWSSSWLHSRVEWPPLFTLTPVVGCFSFVVALHRAIWRRSQNSIPMTWKLGLNWHRS